MEFIGRRLNKGSRNGLVKSYDSSRLLFEIAYDDGNEPDFIDLTALIASLDDDKPRVSNNDKLGNLFANSVVDNGDDVKIIDLNIESNVEKMDSFDLNMDLDEDTKNEDVDLGGYTRIDDISVVENENENVENLAKGKRRRKRRNVEHLGMDNNVVVSLDNDDMNNVVVRPVENSVVETKTEKAVENDGSLGKGRVGRKRRKVTDEVVDNKNEDVDVGGYTKEKDVECLGTDNVVVSLDNDDTDNVVVENEGSLGKGRGGKKRKKVVTDFSPGSGSVLRRSARRQAAMASVENVVKYDVGGGGGNDVVMESPVISAVSEDRNMIEEPSVVPTELEFPPSTGNVDLDGLPVLDVFSVYAFLRSFSTTLFLSPFGLGDFVLSIRSKSPNLLIDSIHVSLLRVLRKRLEFLASENIKSAANCLRDLNWDLLDAITWPMFMAEYVLTIPDFDHALFKLFKSDYHKQSELLKVQLLQYICDDVTEVEAISLELNRRIVGTEPTNATDPDLSTKSVGSKKRRGRRANSCMSEEVIDEVADWNSDECCLCKMDGNLICCDGCPAAYHSKCVGIATNLLPEGDWYCPECVVDKKNSEVKVAKSIRGADLLAVDPHGRLYYSSCGYLLVSDKCDGETSFHYYQMNDLTAIINALNSLSGTYRATSNAIAKHWRLYTKHYGEKDISHSAGSSELSEAITGTKKSSKSRRHSSNGSSGAVGTHVNSSNNGYELSGKTATKKGMSQQLEIGYLNLYGFARVASSVFGDWIRKPTDKSSRIPTKSLEELISVQMKAISKTSVDFCWSNIQNVSLDAQKEKCGWCLACRYPTDDGNCLFFKNNPTHVESFTCELLGFDSKINGKDRLIDVMCHILYVEERLHGLLLGPWLNPQFPKIYRKSFVEASDIAPVKNLLLMLESNIWLRALSDEWLKHVDSVTTVGSASHIVTSKLRVNSRNVTGKKKSALGSEPRSLKNAFTGLSLYWWRGGRLTRKLFNWKVLPRSLASKAARQGGGKKIDGILYPENYEYLKRSKALVWRASVESAVTVEQLALQIRELDANIKWEEIENTSHLAKMDKESIKSMRSFKKAIVRRKSSEGGSVKYLLDFGKRRFIPDPVVKHGSKIEESSSERKKYWVGEPYVPLFLLKPFEDKRIALKSNKMSLSSIPVSGREMKPAKKDTFSYLLAKAELPKNHQCGHCNKDVLIRDAISCQYCEGFFHKRHARKTRGTYTCHKCYVGDTMKTSAKKGKLNSRKTKKVLKNSKKVGKGKQLAHSQAKNKAFAVPLRRSARTAKIVSLQSKKKPVQKKKKSGGKKKQFKYTVDNKYTVDEVEKPKGKRGRPRKIKKESLKKKRTHVHTSYWLNGLLLSRNPDDERVTDFRAKNHIVSFEQPDPIADLPTCRLCDEPEFRSSLNYINCETCGEWYHGDAFGLNNEYTAVVIGFKCHKCRERAPPICPHLQSISYESMLAEQTADEGGKFGDETLSEVLLEKTDTIEEGKASPGKLNAETVPDSKQDPAKEVCGKYGDEMSSEVLMTEKTDTIEERKASPTQLNAETVPDSKQDPEKDLCRQLVDEISSEVLMTEKTNIIEDVKASPQQLIAEIVPDSKQDPAEDVCGKFGDKTSSEVLMKEKTNTIEEWKASPSKLNAETVPDSKQDPANDVHNAPDSIDAHGEDSQNRSDLGQADALIDHCEESAPRDILLTSVSFHYKDVLENGSLSTHKESSVAVAQNGSLKEEKSNTSLAD